MKVKLLFLTTTAALLGMFTTSVPRAVVSQGVASSNPPRVETIHGIPVVRSDASIAGPSDIDGLIQESGLIVIGKIEQSLEEAEPLIGRDVNGDISSANSLECVCK